MLQLPQKSKGFFITGTGTGVGKTLVSIGLCLKFEANYWKPVQTGEPADEDYVKHFLSPKKICTGAIRLKAPLSPNQAARLQKINLRVSDIKRPQKRNFLIVEGIGGVLVPLNDNETVLDLIIHLKLPVIVVASSGLGTLNHTLLTLNALKKNKISVSGLVLSGPSHPKNKRDLEHWGQVPVLWELKPLSVITKKSLKKAFHHSLDSFPSHIG